MVPAYSCILEVSEMSLIEKNSDGSKTSQVQLKLSAYTQYSMKFFHKLKVIHYLTLDFFFFKILACLAICNSWPYSKNNNYFSVCMMIIKVFNLVCFPSSRVFSIYSIYLKMCQIFTCACVYLD